MARNLMAKLNVSNGLATEHFNTNVKVDSNISLEDLLNLEDLGTLCQESANDIDNMLLTLEEADEVLDDIQEVENNVANTLGAEPIDVVTGEPLNGNDNNDTNTEDNSNKEDDTTSNNDETLPDNNNKEIAAAVAQESLRYVYKRLQLDFNKIKISQEALIAQPITALHLAREEAQEAGKSLWEKIKEWISNLVKKVLAFLGNVNAVIETGTPILEKIKADIDSNSNAYVSGNNLPEGLGNFILSFSYTRDGKFDGNLLKILTNTTAVLRYIDTESESLLEIADKFILLSKPTADKLKHLENMMEANDVKAKIASILENLNKDEIDGYKLIDASTIGNDLDSWKTLSGHELNIVIKNVLNYTNKYGGARSKLEDLRKKILKDTFDRAKTLDPLQIDDELMKIIKNVILAISRLQQTYGRILVKLIKLVPRLAKASKAS